jgi:hypothetical protein
MKQSFILSKNDYNGEFYHSGPYSICTKFVWNLFGLAHGYIEVTITNKRPHQSRWKRVTRSEEKFNYLSVGGLTFTPLPEHLDLMDKYGGVLWIKIAPSTEDMWRNNRLGLLNENYIK